MEINDELRELILVGASALELKKKAIEQGMITLRRSGLIKCAAGQTTLDEVLRENGSLEKRVEGMSGITLSELLKKMIEMGGSDLHITTQQRRLVCAFTATCVARYAAADRSGHEVACVQRFDGRAKAPL